MLVIEYYHNYSTNKLTALYKTRKTDMFLLIKEC